MNVNCKFFLGFHCKFSLINQIDFSSRKQRSISCNLCSKMCHSNAFQSSILNHMAKKHYDVLRFCCVVCSKVFYNMPLLMQHYKSVHPTASLIIYPCLQCGLYSVSIFSNFIASSLSFIIMVLVQRHSTEQPQKEST